MSTGIARAAPRSAAPKRSARTRPRERRDIRRTKNSAWFAVAAVGAFAFLPVYWLLATALTPDEEVFAFPPRIFPANPTLDNFAALADRASLARYLLNSAVVSCLTAVLSLVVATYMAWSFSRFRYRGRSSLMYLVLASQMFPQAVLLVTLYAVFSTYGLLNTYAALVLSFSTFTLPLCVWMLKGFFDTIPTSLLEAATIDGASRWRVLHSIVLPLSAPGLLAAGLFAFMRGWNDFIFALTLAGPDRQTLPPGLVNTYLGEFQTAWPELMAASLVVSLPVVVAFIALQRFLVGGLAAGAVKG